MQFVVVECVGVYANVCAYVFADVCMCYLFVNGLSQAQNCSGLTTLCI